ncbi:Hypothetical protein RG1141_PA05590 (plasmid) [Neorhizobium galegae bv. officinalis bv. officinalis str. HAMBI 1141]|uniref:Uncharacterized protein n=1 Tax=Neorhizobium galegae bv. officinalis bv. officinalis str. HAMBI 1141 TaxID=1028801 RepID=A0A068TH37_NEOGA|nr:hypothetical protein [Neorhizobium galegae]CDN57394.1 Hypothetical protein RG1141_PA05590 [Neorhizobium galegae bv. officinalis bv. officinalis str. HAMBI 1141]
MNDAGKRKKLLIVERKLVHNRGHHHTQISALRTYLPDHETSLVAGETYDGFLGAAAGELTAKSVKLAKLRSRLLHGNVFERLEAGFGALKSVRTIKLPPSAFGAQLAEICQGLQLGADDLVIVPTAELDTLESAVELTAILGDAAPRICLRFLNSELGDRNERLRSKRLEAILTNLPANVFLFTETEELSVHFRETFGMPVEGGFYLPCSMNATIIPGARIDRGDRFRIGVFGEPRPEKGSRRLTGIIAALAKLAETRAAPPLDFLIQGSTADFREGGVYGDLRKFQEGEWNIFVSPQDNRISPEEFEQLFHSVDVVLLPYETAIYSLQGSGVVQDAVAAHKPVIHTRYMSMMAFLSHGNGVPATTDQEFAEAILRVAADPLSLQEGTARAAVYFRNALAGNPLLRVLQTSLRDR